MNFTYLNLLRLQLPLHSNYFQNDVHLIESVAMIYKLIVKRD